MNFDCFGRESECLETNESWVSAEKAAKEGRSLTKHTYVHTTTYRRYLWMRSWWDRRNRTGLVRLPAILMHRPFVCTISGGCDIDIDPSRLSPSVISFSQSIKYAVPGNTKSLQTGVGSLWNCYLCLIRNLGAWQSPKTIFGNELFFFRHYAHVKGWRDRKSVV